MTEITSFEANTVGQFGDIMNQKTPLGPPKVGLLACGYFEYWRMYPSLRETVEQDLQGICDRLSEHLDIVYPGMVDTMDKADAAGRALAAEDLTCVIVVEGTYLPDFITLQALHHIKAVPVVLFNTQTGADVSPTDGYEATMRNSCLIGISQLTGTFRKMGRPYEVVVGENQDPATYRQLQERVATHDIVRRLQTQTIGLVGQVFRGMYDLEYDPAMVKGTFGPEVMTIQVDHLVDAFEAVSEDEARQTAQGFSERFAMQTVTSADIERSCRLGLAMKALMQSHRLDSLCFLGQHYIEKRTHAPARLGASMLLDDGIMVACEGDVGGLVVMQIMHALTGAIPLQAEWGQVDIAHNALFMLGHGIASPSHAVDDSHVTLTRSPEEWGFEGNGVNYQLILKPGPVTMAHVLHTPSGWRLLVTEADSIDFPCLPCEEVHAMVRLTSPVTEYVASILELGVSHHMIIVSGHIGQQLALVADRMHIECVRHD